MCKQIRHTYYCEELFLIKHKTKHSCESAIFYNLTADVVYSVCQFDYFYNTTVTPSILDGGSNILLANMLSPKRLICTKDSPMARPLPSHPYILVNRSILCNCHLQTGLTYLLRSLSSCDSGTAFTMYFTVNSAFQHFMSEFGLSDSPNPDGRLLSQEHIFDIFLCLKAINIPKHIMVHTSFGPSRYSFGTVSIHILQAPYFPQFAFFSYCPAYQYENSKLS